MEMIFKSFSPKQRLLLTWFCENSEFKNRDAIIADGAVRSGKTLCMSIGFILWAFKKFNNADFAICGKTITSVKRNVITPLVKQLTDMGYYCEEKSSKNYIDISFSGRKNRLYIFGGRDESSASLIQGITLSGIMLDEVCLMPRSFVEQALARCSVSGSKFWFNCNPENPNHWFYTEWIKKIKEKNVLYIHFKMTDNPSLSKKIINRYKSLYSGTFYERFVLGRWVVTQGVIYPMFNRKIHLVDDIPSGISNFYVSCDYGTVNPTSMGLWGEYENKWYRISEYYYNSRLTQTSKTDEEYYVELTKLCENKKIKAIVIDPSAASFIECIRRHNNFKVIP
ncbi:MAG: PBSX family phage terminase large subunit, partial [Oscillospiraceae bacterium]